MVVETGVVELAVAEAPPAVEEVEEVVEERQLASSLSSTSPSGARYW
jgi:hypothetical protein